MNSSLASRISLGTANFNKSYGRINPEAVPSGDIKGISQLMKKYDLKSIDTALAYSNTTAEFSDWETDFFRDRDVTTKFAIRNFKDGALESEILDAFHRDLNRKNLRKYKNVLLHDFSDLLGQKSNLTLGVLSKLKSLDLTESIGFSAYDSAEIDFALQMFQPDVIQIPLNIFDQRLITSGHIKKLTNMGIRIQARSIFLQGLLLTKSENIPAGIEFASNSFKQWWNFVESESLNPLELCLSFVSSIIEIKEIVIGVYDSAQLEQILKIQPTNKNYDLSRFVSCDVELLDPRRWHK